MKASLMIETPCSPSDPLSRRRRAKPVWARWTDEKLLDVRICDLAVSIEGTPLERRIADVHRELEGRGISFRTNFWLSDDWFTPDGVPGVAIPFYLAHPRLARLELSQMLEVEGGTKAWCMRILRHELGHAIDNAYRLQLRRRRQKLFGRSSTPYPEYYTPKPYSKRFVIHLDPWYSQSHPDEDFAETFAVWLTPHSMWRKRYTDWPAIKKLEYIDGLMQVVARTKPVETSLKEVEPLRRIRRTLRQHYARKRKHYGLDHPNFYDRDLQRLFSDAPDFSANMLAAKFITKNRRAVRRLVSSWTSVYQYTIDQVLEDMIVRCRKLNLHLTATEERSRHDFTVLLTIQTMNFLHGGRHRVAL